MLAATITGLLLLPAQALNTGDLALVGYYYQGVCPPDPSPSPDVASGCFHGGTPSVDCRQENSFCPSTQIEAISLQSETRPGPCSAFTWRWYCAEEALVHCVDHVWCDPLALCNASAATCTCQGNLVSIDHGRCGCGPKHFLSGIEASVDASNQWTNYSCEPVTECNATRPIEVAAPTATSDRVCVTSTTTTTSQTPSTDLEHWYTVSLVLSIAVGVVATVGGIFAYRNYRDHGSIYPA